MKKNSVRLTALILALVLSLALVLTGCGSKSTSRKIASANDTTTEARALLLLQEDGSVKMIRRAETPADYFATFDFGEYGPKLAEEAKIKM